MKQHLAIPPIGRKHPRRLHKRCVLLAFILHVPEPSHGAVVDVDGIPLAR